MLGVPPLELTLMALFALFAIFTFGRAGWIMRRWLYERNCFRRGVKALDRGEPREALRWLRLAEEAWTPAALHPTAGNRQKSLEDYAEIVAYLADAGRRLGLPCDDAPLREAIGRRILLINRGLFVGVPHREVAAAEHAFRLARTQLRAACRREPDEG